MISLDTETTGVDMHHGAKPFFVTTCNDQGDLEFFEWHVNPINRQPEIPSEDLNTILSMVRVNNLVLQNPKFDVSALASLDARFGDEWPWERTDDTLIAGHLLHSSMPHDLTSMVLHYLGEDMQPFENRLQDACNKSRAMARSKFPEWRIAKKGADDMPSAKEKNWKYDLWLPRALARELKYPDDHPWWTVCQEYANRDAETTICLWPVLLAEIKRRGLYEIYRDRMRLLPVAYKMQAVGVSVSRERLTELTEEYRESAVRSGRVCVNIAKGLGYDLSLPKGGRNKSLNTFIFDTLNLPVLKYTDTGNASMNKDVLSEYYHVLPTRSKERMFIQSLRNSRQLNTAVSYMEGYTRFWVPMKGADGRHIDDWYRLHPSLNPTGTDTLRWSSSNPNEQNISKKEGFNLRYCFGPAPGREWWSMDAKNIELRIPAYESREEEFIALFERPDEPPYYGSNHLLIFHLLWTDLWETAVKEVGPDKVGVHCKKRYASSNYQWTKNGNFAVQYGAIDREDGTGTADVAYHQPGAQAKIKARFTKQEALNQWCIRYAEKHGYIETLPDKTVNASRGYPLVCTRTEYGRIKPTVPLNYRVQGTAMQWMNKAMVRTQDQLDEWNRGRNLADQFHGIMQVHDELVFDFPKSSRHPMLDRGIFTRVSNLWRARRLQQLMAQGGDDIGVPTPVNLEYHDSSYDQGITL